jgi:hypothetical protein
MFRLFNLGSSAERRHVLPPLLLFFAAVFLSLDVAAATRTWTGAGGDNRWSTAANWGGTAPVAGDDLVFPNGALQLSNTNDLAGGTSFHSISFPGPVGGYTISGNPIQLVAGLTANNNTRNYFNLAIGLTAPQTFTIFGDGLRFNGPINLGSNTLTFAGPTGVVTLNGAVSGTGGISSSVWAFVVVTTLTYTGPTNVTGGDFVVLVPSSLSPSSVVTVSGGVLQFANGGSTGQVTVNSPATLACVGGGTSNIGNLTNLTLQSGSHLTMGIDSTSHYGRLNASGNVNLGGATLQLSWAFTSSPGNTFTIINKTSPGAITGTFASLPEGAKFTSNGRTYRITYQGGDGNDVVVTDPVAFLPAILLLLLD